MKFSQKLEEYLDLRDDLKDEEVNFTSIRDRYDARRRLDVLAEELDEFFNLNPTS